MRTMRRLWRTTATATSAVYTWQRYFLALQRDCCWAHSGLRQWRGSSPSAGLSNGTHSSLWKLWDGSWCESQSLSFPFAYSPSLFVCWKNWTHHDVTLCLVQNGAVLRRVSSHTLHLVGV